MSGLMYPVVLIGVGGALAGPLLQQRAEQPTLSSGTDLVTLSVGVVDRRGAPVTGLLERHFTVYDNGERQTIRFFSGAAMPATVGLLMDNSGSMRGRDADKAAVAAAFAAISRPLDELFSLQFNDVVWPGVAPPGGFTQDAERLLAGFVAAPAAGMTALYDAVVLGLEQLRRGTRDRRVLIVVSDGGDNASRQPLAAVLERAGAGGAAIYAVTLFDPDNRDARPDVLKLLARQTGGRAFVARRPEDIARCFARIGEEIRSGYTIGFVPADTSAAGFRPLRVVVDAGDHRRLVARTRAGYHAGPPTATIR